jgi:hypothetical protein
VHLLLADEERLTLPPHRLYCQHMQHVHMCTQHTADGPCPTEARLKYGFVRVALDGVDVRLAGEWD